VCSGCGPRSRWPRPVRLLPARRRFPAVVCLREAREFRPSPARLRYRGPPHVPLLRGERRKGLRALASTAISAGVLGLHAGASGSRDRTGVRLVLALRHSPSWPDLLLAVAQLAARIRTSALARAVPGLRMAATLVRALCRPERVVRARWHPGLGARAGARHVR